MFADRGEDLRVIVRIAEQAAKDPIGDRLRRILNQRLGIDRFLKAQTVALGTGAIGCVERKVARLQIVDGVSVLRARQRQRVFQQLALGSLGGIAIGQHIYVHITVGKRRRLLDGLGNATQGVLSDHDTIDHDLNIVLELFVQFDGVIERAHFAVDAHAAKALRAQVLEQLGILALASTNNRRQHKRATALPRRKDFIGNLICCLALNDTPTLGAVRSAHASEQQT